MTCRNLALGFAGTLLALVAPWAARGQAVDAFCEPDCEHDLQLFAPVDFDFNCLPIQEECWFFNYNRLSWAVSGERAIIGQPGLTVQAEAIFRQNPLDEGTAPTPYTVINGIQDGGPEAKFANGNRFEVGFNKGGNGWMVGVIQGHTQVTNKVYGFPELSVPNNLPLSQTFPGPGFGDPNTAPDITVNGAFLSGWGDLTTTLHGFGSVHVNFETPAGYLFGWRDYHINGPNNEQAPTTGGPSYIITGLTLDGATGQATDITVVRGADGVVDNLDDDLIAGFGVILIDDGTGNLVPVATFVDYDDLHEFNIRFDRLTARNVTDTDGVEIMKTHMLDNSYLPVKEQRNRFLIGYGARFLKISDSFTWEGLGDVFGRSYAATDVDNQIVGPQIRAEWMHQRGRWGFDLDGRCLFGYNIQDLGQVGGIGENLNPGGLNSPLFAQPTFFAYGQQKNFFSPVAELRAEGRYQVFSNLALKLGYTAIFADNVTRASQIVRYRLPDMGFREDQIGKQTIFMNGVDFGIEALY